LNSFTKAGRSISNERARTSRTSTNEEVDYNLVFKGQRTIALFTIPRIVDEGREDVFSKDDSFAAVSAFNYNEVCLEFIDKKPQDAFYNEVDEICAKFVDISSSRPTLLSKDITERTSRTRSSSSANEFNTI